MTWSQRQINSSCLNKISIFIRSWGQVEDLDLPLRAEGERIARQRDIAW